MKEWSIVYKTSILSRAEIVRSILQDRGLEAIIMNKKDSTIHISHGLIEVLVPNDHLLKALKIVNDELSFE